MFALVEDGYFCSESDEILAEQTTTDGNPVDTSSYATTTVPVSINVTVSNDNNETASLRTNTTQWESTKLASNVLVTTSGLAIKTEADCSKYQSEQLNNVFVLATMLLSFSSLVNGYIYDTFGTWIARCLAIILFTGGCVLAAFSTAKTAWLLYPCMSCFAVGGIMLLLTNLQIGNLFGKFRTSVITLMSGSLDSSSFVFLIFKTLHHSGISLSTMFQFMAWCTILLWVRTFVLLPKKSFPFPIEKGYDYGIGDCRSKKNVEEKELAIINSSENEEKKALTTTEPVETIKNAPPESVMVYVKTSLFWVGTFHFSMLQLRNYFYLGMLNDSLRDLTDDKEVLSSYLTVFGICQLFGALSAPLNGFLIDGISRALLKKKGDSEVVPLLAVMCSAIVTTLLGTVFSVLVAIPYLPVQYGAFVLQVIFRSFLYGGLMSFIAVAFPIQHFGKLYGLAMFIGGLVLLLQFPLATLVLRVLDGSFYIINIVFVFVCLVTIVHPINIYRWCKMKQAKTDKSIVNHVVS